MCASHELSALWHESCVCRRCADGSTKRRRVVLVFYIGGVTFLELAALRFLTDKRMCAWGLRVVASGRCRVSRHRSLCCAVAVATVPFEFIVATTAIINSTKFLDSIAEPLENLVVVGEEDGEGGSVGGAGAGAGDASDGMSADD